MTWQGILTVVGLPVVGALLLHVWNRYKGRMARLFWSAEHIPMALATTDTGFGEVQVLYNGQPTVTHEGVRLEYREPGTDIFGVRRTHAQIAGVIVGVLIVATTIALDANSVVAGSTGWLLGAFLLAFGALVVKLIRALGNILS